MTDRGGGGTVFPAITTIVATNIRLRNRLTDEVTMHRPAALGGGGVGCRFCGRSRDP
jgi:hypothetical protein